jgi:hypothetical protein|tara:strand:+ start:222 stop:827 length:606 start_codon:yes stop_codon:yes gene_type:complete
MIDLSELIKNNMAILDATLDNKVTLAEQKLARQQEALAKLYAEIKPAIKGAGHYIALVQTCKNNLYKARCYEDQWNNTDTDMAKLIMIEFRDPHIEHTGESEDFYAPHVRTKDKQHSSSYSSAYIKISWDDDKGVYFIVPNVAYTWNRERDDVDKRTYLELQGTKDMIIERLAVVLASVMRISRDAALVVAAKVSEGGADG